MFNPVNTIKNAADKAIASVVSSIKPTNDIQAASSSKATVSQQDDAGAYNIKYSNWYKALPYGFRFRDRYGNQLYYFLPISPQNLTITTHYATNIISTLYGTVEEHSEQRYFDIVIEGTTGISPRYTKPLKQVGGNVVISSYGNEAVVNDSSGRKSYGDGPPGWKISSSILGGFGSQTIGSINNVLGKAHDLVEPKETGFNVSGVAQNESGYTAFHRFYKAFFNYKADAAGFDITSKEPIITTRGITDEENKKKNPTLSRHPLTFLNYKDNNKYDCAITRFVLRRDISNPILYKYSITLRAYNIRSIEAQEALLDELNGRLANLGLAGVQSSSLLSEVRDKADKVKNIIGAALGGINVFGR